MMESTTATTKREREEEEPIAWFIGKARDGEGGFDGVDFLSFGSAPTTETMMVKVRKDLARLVIDKRDNDNWVEEYGLRPLMFPEQLTNLIDPDKFNREHLCKLRGLMVLIKQGENFLHGKKWIESGQKGYKWHYSTWGMFYPEEITDDTEWTDVKATIWQERVQDLDEKWVDALFRFRSALKAVKQGKEFYDPLLYTSSFASYRNWDTFDAAVTQLANINSEIYKELDIDALVAETKEQARKTNEFIETLQTKRRITEGAPKS